MDIIHLLPDSVANQIAAGEVIQRPASCLKELVENSLDAGATNIQILLYDAGRTLMQVIDNGKGMSEMDARMAFERHATSKISSAQDLFSLRTMGFRGEALASICAVAQVEMTSRRADDEIGTCIEINGSEVVCQEPCVCQVGTNFKVKNLFYNVPARRRFLKTDATELRNILQEFYRIVLVNPQCQFTICNNDEILLELPAGTAKQRIEQVFGKTINKQFTASLVDVKTDTDLVSIRGYVGKPEFAGKTAQQFFFVNNRYMRHPYFHKAVMTAYQGMLAADHNPSYFIYFDINPESIDVNIHPTKTEIKFADEQSIWQILMAAVRESLGKFNVAPSLDFEVAEGLEIPAPLENAAEVTRPEISFDPTYNPFQQSNNYQPQWNQGSSRWNEGGTDSQAGASRWNEDSASRDGDASLPWKGDASSWKGDSAGTGHYGREQGGMPRKQSTAGWEQLYGTLGGNDSMSELDTTLRLFDDDLSNLLPYQYDRKYILLPAHAGLLFIDQHRAHVCILSDQLQQSLRDHRGVTQQLLFPETIELAADDMPLMQQAADDLQYVGFDISQLSRTAYCINGLPAILGEENAVKALNNILAMLREEGVSARSKWRATIIHQLAEESAIPAGKSLSEAEMRDMVQRLFGLDQFGKTPAGRVVMQVLPHADINKMF